MTGGEEPNLGIAGELGRKLEATGCCEPTLFSFSLQKMYLAWSLYRLVFSHTHTRQHVLAVREITRL